jgi:hypothetical protein
MGRALGKQATIEFCSLIPGYSKKGPIAKNITKKG